MIRTYTLAPDDRADASVKTILRALFNTLQSKVEGVIADADIEYLHDLRVANRRTRTVLSQIKGVLASAIVERFVPEFRWIGTVSGPCRDLDVALFEIERYRQDPALDGEGVAQLTSFFSTRRADEHERVAIALRSARFGHLVEGWGGFLGSTSATSAGPPLASTAIIDVSGPRILKAHKRLRKRGAGITRDAPTSLLHQLRIDGKKLRYLLEFFSDLYDPNVVSRCIKELKRFQDILGDFNDTEVQLAMIREFVDHDPSLAASSPIIANLESLINARQDQLRDEFLARFADFASDESRKLYKKTFKR